MWLTSVKFIAEWHKCTEHSIWCGKKHVKSNLFNLLRFYFGHEHIYSRNGMILFPYSRIRIVKKTNVFSRSIHLFSILLWLFFFSQHFDLLLFCLLFLSYWNVVNRFRFTLFFSHYIGIKFIEEHV